jgi:hypothetical protein
LHHPLRQMQRDLAAVTNNRPATRRVVERNRLQCCTRRKLERLTI